MRIINVIIQKAGIVESVESFPILEEQLSQEQIKKAEEVFEKWCRDNGYEDGNELETETMESLIEEGYWENSNYDSVFLTWSNVNL